MPDPGHDLLIADLRNLLRDAEAFEFHDFMNGKYAAPKVALHTALLRIDSNVSEGRYDNHTQHHSQSER
jgi:hypothetical protein